MSVEETAPRECATAGHPLVLDVTTMGDRLPVLTCRCGHRTEQEATPVTLTEFLLPRIAEEERLAQATLDYGRKRYEHNPADLASINEATGYEPDDGWLTVSAPRVLAECEAKRRIVGWCSEAIGPRDLATYGQHGALADDPDALAVTLAVETLRALALPYADHPDYREEWRP